MHECNIAGWQSTKTKSPCTHADLHSITWPRHIIQQPFLQIYVSSSGTPVGTKFTAIYVGMVVVQCGHVMECIICMCAWTFLLVYFVSQCIHALSHPYMGWISFLKSFYEDLFLFCYAVLPTHLRFMRHRSLSGPSKVVGPRETSCLLRKKVQAVSR